MPTRGPLGFCAKSMPATRARLQKASWALEYVPNWATAANSATARYGPAGHRAAIQGAIGAGREAPRVQAPVRLSPAATRERQRACHGPPFTHGRTRCRDPASTSRRHTGRSVRYAASCRRHALWPDSSAAPPADTISRSRCKLPSAYSLGHDRLAAPSARTTQLPRHSSLSAASLVCHIVR